MKDISVPYNCLPEKRIGNLCLEENDDTLGCHECHPYLWVCWSDQKISRQLNLYVNADSKAMVGFVFHYCIVFLLVLNSSLLAETQLQVTATCIHDNTIKDLIWNPSQFHFCDVLTLQTSTLCLTSTSFFQVNHFGLLMRLIILLIYFLFIFVCLILFHDLFFLFFLNIFYSLHEGLAERLTTPSCIPSLCWPNNWALDCSEVQ